MAFIINRGKKKGIFYIPSGGTVGPTPEPVILPEFITEWTVGAGVTITLPSYGGTFLYDVDWGDGQTETGITALNKTHDYTATGADTYIVKITGQFASLRMDSGTAANQLLLTKMSNWGTGSQWYTLRNMFKGCVNMVYEATDKPDLTALNGNKGFIDTFRDCDSAISLDLSGWTNTNNFTDFTSSFLYNEYLTTLNMSGWDFSGGTSCSNMFKNVGSLGTGCAINLSNTTFPAASCSYMFRGAKFSSDPVLTNADVSGVNNLIGAFQDTEGNVNVDLSTWNFSTSITSLASFGKATEASSFTFGSASSFTNVTSFDSIFINTINPLTITFPSNADFSKITTMGSAFYGNGINSITSINLGTIQDFGLVTTWTSSFRTHPAQVRNLSVNFVSTANIQATTALSSLLTSTTILTSQYNNLLQALDAAGNSSGNLNAGSSTYTTSGAGGTARTNLLARSWTISDGGGI